MSPVGHTLTGLTIGYLAVPRATPTKTKFTLLAAIATLASAPDWPLPYWGHFRYEISHSLLMTTIGTMLLSLILTWRFRWNPPVTLRVIIGMVLAWYSHLLLDSFYNHGYGVYISWPWQRARFALPIPWLANADREHVFSMHNVRVALYELATFGPLLILAMLSKKCVVPTANEEGKPLT